MTIHPDFWIAAATVAPPFGLALVANLSDYRRWRSSLVFQMPSVYRARERQLAESVTEQDPDVIDRLDAERDRDLSRIKAIQKWASRLFQLSMGAWVCVIAVTVIALVSLGDDQDIVPAGLEIALIALPAFLVSVQLRMVAWIQIEDRSRRLHRPEHAPFTGLTRPRFSNGSPRHAVRFRRGTITCRPERLARAACSSSSASMQPTSWAIFRPSCGTRQTPMRGSR